MLEELIAIPDMAERRKATSVVNETRQAGSICYRPSAANGSIEVLLVGSLRNGRWGLPKGHLNPGETTRDAALREAFEEAGIRGTAKDDVFGQFLYYKQGNPKRFRVAVHLIAVSGTAEDYPERAIRKVKWVSLTGLAEQASRPGLRTILRRFELMMQPGE